MSEIEDEEFYGKKEDNSDYQYMIYYLEKDGSEKAKEMLVHIKAIKTNLEFITFKWELNHKILLEAF